MKVRKIGNSLGVILPKELLHALHVEGENAVLHVTETPDGFQISPYDPDFEQGMSAFRRIRSRYRDTLHELAK
ncbi:MAG: hypothetical protein KIT83_15795 [Bryobacterales bacterium]|nr:hypothetical protein [Bryobacterales bacterium]